MENLTLSVTCRNGYETFRIRDDGGGVPPERMGKLFTGYIDRKDTPADGSRNNMGIGLSVCSAIVKAHGSEITVTNPDPRGAEFSFSLEMEETNEHQQI
jgi:two-component system sensor histidine kinase KdpD